MINTTEAMTINAVSIPSFSGGCPFPEPLNLNQNCEHILGSRDVFLYLSKTEKANVNRIG